MHCSTGDLIQQCDWQYTGGLGLEGKRVPSNIEVRENQASRHRQEAVETGKPHQADEIIPSVEN